MAGVKALRKLQLGKESTAGTKVNATFVWRGLGTGQDVQTLTVPEEDIGVLMQPDRTFVGSYAGAVEFEESNAIFEQIPYIFEAGVEAETPTQDGAGSDYIYTYNIPTTAQNTLNTYTIEWGDDQQEYESGYGHVTEFTLSGAAGEAMNNAATWMTQQPAKGTYTAALTAPTGTSPILFQNFKIYIDDAGTYPATTQITNSLISFSLTYATGIKAVYTGDGSLDFSFTKKIRPEATLEITLEHDGSAVTEWDKFQAETTRNIRLECTGPAVATPGTTYSNKMFIIDATGRYTSVTGLEDDDGNDTITLTLQMMYNVSDTTAGRFIVVNELSALP